MTMIVGTPTSPPKIEAEPVLSRGVGRRCQHVYRFANDLGASVVPIQGDMLWEVATLRFTGPEPADFTLARDLPGYISNEMFVDEVAERLAAIAHV